MAELCFNLWYYLNEQQEITGLSARAYLLDGSDADKERLLRQLSRLDYRVVRESAPPGGVPVPYRALKRRGVEVLYAEIFEAIRQELPPSVPFPEEKLFYATPLYDFGAGFVPARIADGFISTRD